MLRVSSMLVCIFENQKEKYKKIKYNAVSSISLKIIQRKR